MDASKAAVAAALEVHEVLAETVRYARLLRLPPGLDERVRTVQLEFMAAALEAGWVDVPGPSALEYDSWAGGDR